jgi:hypothetical protein
MEGAVFKPFLAVFPGTPFIYVAITNALQRPICAASNVIRAGIRNFWVPSLIDLPETSTFSPISGRFWMVPRFVRNNPFGDLRTHASGFGSAFNKRPNSESSLRIGSQLQPSRRGGNWTCRDFILESVGQ